MQPGQVDFSLRAGGRRRIAHTDDWMLLPYLISPLILVDRVMQSYGNSPLLLTGCGGTLSLLHV